MDADELQRIARLVEMNRQKMATLEEQISRLEKVINEQATTIAALEALPDHEGRTMFAVGAGVQVPAQVLGDGVVIDIGSGVQAERERGEALEILRFRQAEVEAVLGELQSQFDEAEASVTTLATQFNEGAAAYQAAQSEAPEEAPASDSTTKPVPRRRRRGFGSELTLDD